jgi:hypothetical protein
MKRVTSFAVAVGLVILVMGIPAAAQMGQGGNMMGGKQANDSTQTGQMGMYQGMNQSQLAGHMNKNMQMMTDQYTRMQQQFNMMMNIDDMAKLKAEMQSYQQEMQNMHQMMSQQMQMSSGMMSMMGEQGGMPQQQMQGHGMALPKGDD